MKKDLQKKLKIILIILLVLFIGETVFLGIKLYNRRKNTTYYDIIYSVIDNDNNYIAVGMTDFKNSKLTKYVDPGYNKPFIRIYDEKFNSIKEENLAVGFNGSFNDVIKISDGYLAVGSISMTEEKNNKNITEATIVKYDFDLKLIWRKNFKIFDSTEFTKVNLDQGENIIVLGRTEIEGDSFEVTVDGKGNMIGTSNGKAFLLKLDKEGKEILRIENGKTKSDVFNDVIVLADGYVVVGLINSGTGIIYKYDLKGKEVWHNYYGHTDTKGITSIVYDDKYFYVTASKLPEKNSTDKYEGVLVKFDKKGKQIKEEKFKEDDITRLEKVILNDDKLIVLASYGKKEDNYLKNQAFILEYNKELKLINKKNLTGNKTVTFSDIIIKKENYIVSGYTNSKLKKFKTNGYDYFPILLKYDLNLK